MVKPMAANHIKNLLAKIEDKNRRENQQAKLNAAHKMNSARASRSRRR
jgi:hypothetical protein